MLYNGCGDKMKKFVYQEIAECYILNINELSACEYKTSFFEMSDERRKKCREYRFDDDKKRCIAADYLARKIIADKLNKSTAEIIFIKDKNGKPFVENEDIFFSISHSEDYVAVAVSEKIIGVDIEKIRPVKANTLSFFCSDADKMYILGDTEIKNGLIFEDCLERFFEVWTFKEAYFKCSGEGITKGAANITMADFDAHIEKFDAFVLCLYLEK